MGSNVMARTDLWVIGGAVALDAILFLNSDRNDGKANASPGVNAAAELKSQLVTEAASFKS